MSEPVEVVVVGGGAAGMMAALWAGRALADSDSGKIQEGKVTLLESGSRMGVKIAASGGGRCNILPTQAEYTDFHTSGSVNVLKRLMRTWRLSDQRSFFEHELGLPLKEEEDEKIFPVCESGADVRDLFRNVLEGIGVSIQKDWKVSSIEKTEQGFQLESDSGTRLDCKKLVLACGGQSVPASGSDGSGYQLAKQLGHKLTPTYPALVPLTSKDKDFAELSGVSVEVTWRAILNTSVQEERTRDLLITHQGFSGPAILDASHWFTRDGAAIQISWGGGSSEEWEMHLNAKSRRELQKALSDILPKRLAQLLIEKVGLRAEMRCGNLSRGQRMRLVDTLCHFQLPVNGDAGFDVAEVTGGGIPLNDVNPSTLESRCAPGLFLCGEMMDCTGRMGGFNFLWAWITGRLAGESAVKN